MTQEVECLPNEVPSSNPVAPTKEQKVLEMMVCSRY
jgi:hypothetical protein